MVDLRTHLVLFAKAPIAGEVKTRLSPEISAVDARDLYSAFLCDMIESTALHLDIGTLEVSFASRPDRADLPSELIEILERIDPEISAQRGADLGDRLSNAVTTGLARGVDRVAIIGTDHPSLPVSFRHQLVSTTRDLAIGRTIDGGFWGISAKCSVDTVLSRVPWSTERTYRTVLDNAAASGLSVEELPEWYDVDDAADIERLGATEDLADVAPRTASRLRQVRSSEKRGA